MLCNNQYVNKFLECFLKCRVLESVNNEKCKSGTIEFNNDFAEIPEPIENREKSSRCQICKEKVISNYVERREHVVVKHAELISKMISESKNSKKAYHLISVFKMIKEAFPHNAVCSDIQCIACGKTVITNEGRISHITSVHNVAPFKCPFSDCYFSDSNKNKMIKHAKVAHNKIINLTKRNLNYKDRETEIIRKFDHNRKVFANKIMGKFFPVDIKWYENELKEISVHDKVVLQEFKQVFIRGCGALCDDKTISLKNSLYESSKSNGSLIHKKSDKKNDSCRTYMHEKKPRNDNHKIETFSNKFDNKNSKIIKEKIQSFKSFADSRTTNDEETSRYEKRSKMISDCRLNEKNTMYKQVHFHDETLISKSRDSSITFSTSIRKRKFNSSVPINEVEKLSRSQTEVKPKKIGIYIPKDDACLITKTVNDRYAVKRKVYNNSVKKDSKEQSNQIEEGMKKSQKIMSKYSIKNSTRQNYNTENKFNNVKNSSFDSGRTVPNQPINNNPTNNFTDNQSKRSNGSGNITSPIYISSDSCSESESELNNSNGTNSNAMKNNRKLNDCSEKGYKSLSVTLPNYSKYQSHFFQT